MGTHVIGTSTPRGHTGLTDCHFRIIAPDGTRQGTFEHVSVNDIATFMDRYVVTASYIVTAIQALQRFRQQAPADRL